MKPGTVASCPAVGRMSQHCSWSCLDVMDPCNLQWRMRGMTMCVQGCCSRREAYSSLLCGHIRIQSLSYIAIDKTLFRVGGTRSGGV